MGIFRVLEHSCVLLPFLLKDSVHSFSLENPGLAARTGVCPPVCPLLMVMASDYSPGHGGCSVPETLFHRAFVVIFLSHLCFGLEVEPKP